MPSNINPEFFLQFISLPDTEKNTRGIKSNLQDIE